MNIRIGNQTCCNVTAELPFSFALKNGFDAFEWFSDPGRVGWHEDDMSAAERVLVRKTAETHDMLYSVHAPWAADPTMPAGAVAIRNSIDFARDIGAALVNIHLFPKHAAAVYVEALMPLIEVAAASGLRLSLENTKECSPEDVNAVFKLLAETAEVADRTGLCFDMGHANIYDGTRNDYIAYFDQLGGHVPIIHWHAHENWGDRDSHLALFTGAAGDDASGVHALIERLQARDFAGSVVMEQWPQPPEVLINARDKILQMWQEKPGVKKQLTIW